MNITRENIDNLNAVLRMKVEPADYEGAVENVLKDYKKKARVDGFRPGMVPMGLIRKMYYKPVLVDEVNKVVSDALYKFLREGEVKILGEPLAHKEDQKAIDFDNDREFEFAFDLGLAPEIKLDITSKDKVPYYTIKVEKKELDEYRDSVMRRFGDFITVEKAGVDELIKGDLFQADKGGVIVEDGIKSHEVSMSLDMMKDDKQKALFKGKKAGDEVLFDVKAAYPSDSELSSLLKVKKEELASVGETFIMKIAEIKKFEKAEVNQELFDKVYGEGEVKSAEEFDQRLSEEISRSYQQESEYRFLIDAREAMIKKAGLELPVEFLKRWLLETNEKLTREQIEAEFSGFEDDFRWQLIKDHLMQQQDLKVSEEEALETGKAMALAQYRQYGISNIPEEYLEHFAKDMLAKPEEARRIYDRRMEEKVLDFIRKTAKIDDKEVTTEKFRKLFESK
ncbi:MAG: trigger factor [Bacteroidota bacterium]